MKLLPVLLVLISSPAVVHASCPAPIQFGLEQVVVKDSSTEMEIQNILESKNYKVVTHSPLTLGLMNGGLNTETFPRVFGSATLVYRRQSVFTVQKERILFGGYFDKKEDKKMINALLSAVRAVPECSTLGL